MNYHVLWPRSIASVRSTAGVLRARLFVSPFSHLSIVARIAAIALALALPLNLVIVAVIWHLSDAASEAQRTSLLYTARSVAAAVDAKLGEYTALAHALARSPALLDDNLDVFETEARRAFASSADTLVVVADLSGQQLFNSARQPGQPLPMRDAIGIATQKRARETHSTVISDLHFGPVSQSWVVSIEVPIFKDGEPFRMLAASVKAQSFFRLLNDQHIPKDWLAGIVDSQGRFIARATESKDDDQYVGRLSSESWRSVRDQNGVFEVISVAGDPVVTANAHPATSEWLVGIAVKKSSLQAATWQTVRWAMILGGGFSVLSLLFAGAIARSITGPIDRLRQKATTLLAGPLSSMPPFGPPEVKDLWRALKQSAADRDRSDRAMRESEERLRLSNEAAGIGTFTIDVQAGCAHCSPELADMLGLPGLRTAKIEDAFAQVHRDDRHRVETLYEAGLSGAGDGRIKVDLRFVRPGGEIRWMTWAGRVKFRQGPSGRMPFRVAGACVDITERKRAEDHIRLLMREVNHRSKNLLTVVQAIARQTAAATPNNFITRFEERIEALATSQDVLVKHEWKGANLTELVRSQLAHFEDLIGQRIALRGPSLFISASAAQAIGMALHELATNAGKYGALATGEGRVVIEWGLEDANSSTQNFVMSWHEQAGHPIGAPSKRGFGSTVICEMAELSLGAKVDLDFPSTGLSWRLRCPATQVLEKKNAGSVDKSQKTTTGSEPSEHTRPRILVVEDEAIVALEMAKALIKEGFEVVGPARAVNQALQLINEVGCDAAVLDVNLGAETSEPVALSLIEQGKPFLTVSGYSRDQHPPVFHNAPKFAKPLRPELLVAELKRCIAETASIVTRLDPDAPSFNLV